jgi:hypothetical protein
VTRFIDGPAEGALLMLQRTPLYLRATIRRTDAGKRGFDALDQLDDTPAPDETIVAYRLASTDGTIHIDRTDPRTRRRVGSWHRLVTYAVVDPQPDDVTMRDITKWRAWCLERQKEDKKSTP